MVEKSPECLYIVRKFPVGPVNYDVGVGISPHMMSVGVAHLECRVQYSLARYIIDICDSKQYSLFQGMTNTAAICSYSWHPCFSVVPLCQKCRLRG